MRTDAAPDTDIRIAGYHAHVNFVPVSSEVEPLERQIGEQHHPQSAPHARQVRPGGHCVGRRICARPCNPRAHHCPHKGQGPQCHSQDACGPTR